MSKELTNSTSEQLSIFLRWLTIWYEFSLFLAATIFALICLITMILLTISTTKKNKEMVIRTSKLKDHCIIGEKKVNHLLRIHNQKNQTYVWFSFCSHTIVVSRSGP